MNRERAWLVATALGLLGMVLMLGYLAGAFGVPWATDREAGVVAVTDVESGETACVRVEVADTRPQRYEGLSGHESLANGTGMWFVHSSEGNRTYVMRKMDFAIDVVFVDGDGRVTNVASLRAPADGEDGESIQGSGRAKWVLEVPAGYAAAHGIDAGDRVDVTYGTRNQSACPA